MKIQLASTLPFSPVQLDPSHTSPRRTVGTLHGSENGVEYRLPVYEFRHCEDVVHYRVELSGRLDPGLVQAPGAVASTTNTACDEPNLVWVEHNDTLTYKPYAFVVMNAMTRLVGEWDGIVYRTPSGERLRESAFQATVQVIDACVSPESGLWMMVNLTGQAKRSAALDSPAVRQMGWIPVA